MRQFSTKAFGLFHRIFAAGSRPGGFRLELRLTLAALLLAAATFGGVFFGVAQAQDANGAITGLALSSDSPGTLVVSWDMPSPAPSDYRVDWAKSGESYQSYKVDEGHVYPEGSLTTVTITDLEAGTEYKVRMRARYNQGEHANSPWSGPWQEASLTVAAEPTPEPTAEPAPEPTAEPTEEPESGAIGSPTATDDNAGRLVIAWQAPQAPHDAPTDYRVSWARSVDDYPSYTEEHGNAHPATPTHTLEGLDRDTKYKIRIRARYSPNGQYDAHWSGPWTEITARVVSSPPDTRKNSGAPAAPTLIGTAVTPEGHVTLLWLDPADDSITGYRVLRGPDAESLAVIEEDTGSTAISYIDTEPPAGQTHAYAVQARNAAGLSPLSNTRTATVPQNEEEEEPVALRQETVTTLVTNLDWTPGEPLTVSVNGSRATSFTAAAGPWARYELSGIRIRASRTQVSAQPTPLFTVHRDDGGLPAAAPLYTLDNPSDILSDVDTDYRDYTLTAPAGATLDAGATYWVVFATESGPYLVQATSDTTQTGDGWMIGDLYLFLFGGTWRTVSDTVAQFELLGTGVGLLDEDPDVDLPGGAHDCQLTDGVVVVGQTSSGHLTAGVDTSSGLTGDCFRLETQWGKQYRVEVKFGDTESVDIGGSAWIVYTGSDFSGMSSLGSAVDHNREDGRTFTDFKHNNSTVKSYFVDVAAYDLYSTPYSTNSLTYNGPYTITLTDITGVAMMVSNLDQVTVSLTRLEFPLTSGTDTATEIDLGIAFTVGAHPFGYRLDRVRVPFNYLAEAGASPAIAIYSNSSDTPNTKVCDIAVPTKIVESALTWGGNPPPHEFLAPDCANNTLVASTQYWIVFSNLNHVDYDLGITDSTDEQEGFIHDNQGDRASGWEIGYSTAVRRDSGSWANTTSRIFRAEFWAKER